MEWINPGSISYRRPDDPDKTAHYAVILDGNIQLKSIAYDRTLQLAEAKRLLKNDRMMRTELQDFMFFLVMQKPQGIRCKISYQETAVSSAKADPAVSFSPIALTSPLTSFILKSTTILLFGKIL